MLRSIVGLWEANNDTEDLTYESLVDAAKPKACDDCTIDVTPYDEDGHPTEGAWEWYMVHDAVWEAASRDGQPARILCMPASSSDSDHEPGATAFPGGPLATRPHLKTEKLCPLRRRAVLKARS